MKLSLLCTEGSVANLTEPVVAFKVTKKVISRRQQAYAITDLIMTNFECLFINPNRYVSFNVLHII